MLDQVRMLFGINTLIFKLARKCKVLSNADVSIIIVNFNSESQLNDCLKSIIDHTREIKFEIFIVDNNSSDSSVDMVKEQYPSVHLIANLENAGFAKANNQAIRLSTGRYILLLNPDTLIVDDAITKMVRFLDHKLDVDIAGCKLLNADGSVQYSIGRFPTLLNQLALALFLHRIFPKSTAFAELITLKEHYETDHEIDWVFGAVLMVRRDILNEVGLLDEAFFLFSEEKDWCYRAKAAGKKVFYYHDAKIIHYGRGPNTTPEIFTQLTLSRLQFYKKHNSSLKYQLLRFVVAANVLFRTFTWFIIDKVGMRSKANPRARFELYRSAYSRVISLGKETNFRHIQG